MGFATARTISLAGASGHLVDVQVDLAHGVVATALVGRPDASINEARDRCRAAVANSGFEWPSTRRVTILLSPADLPKRGSHFDLAIAVGVLAAAGKVPRRALDGVVFVGELTLDGRLRAVPGVLPMTLAARTRGMELRGGAGAAGGGGARWSRGWPWSAPGRCCRWWPTCAGTRSRRRRRSTRCPARRC